MNGLRITIEPSGYGVYTCTIVDGPSTTMMPIDSLDQLLRVLRLGGIVDGWERLPTFGGLKPEPMTMVLSWDTERVLFGTRPEDFAIMSRVEWLRWHRTIDAMRKGGYTIDTERGLGAVVKHFERKGS